MARKANSKPSQTSEMELFLASEAADNDNR